MAYRVRDLLDTPHLRLTLKGGGRGPGHTGDLGADLGPRRAVVVSGGRRTADEERPDTAGIPARPDGAHPRGCGERHVRHGDRVGRGHPCAHSGRAGPGRLPRLSDHGGALLGWVRLDRTRCRRCRGQRPRRRDRTGLQRDPAVGEQSRARQRAGPAGTRSVVSHRCARRVHRHASRWRRPNRHRRICAGSSRPRSPDGGGRFPACCT